MLNSPIGPIDRTLSGATTPSQSGPGSDGNEGIFRILQSFNVAGASLSDGLVSYPGHSLRGVLLIGRNAVGVFNSSSRLCKVFFRSTVLIRTHLSASKVFVFFVCWFLLKKSILKYKSIYLILLSIYLSILGKTIVMEVNPEDYMPYMGRENDCRLSMRIAVYCKVKQTEQLFVYNDSFHMDWPYLNIEVNVKRQFTLWGLL